MGNQNNITVLSTFANDKLFNQRGQLLREQKGGPAYFIKKALEKEKASFKLFSPPIVEVEILMKEDGESGKIPKKPKKLKIDCRNISSPYVLVSTLLDEVDLIEVSKLQGKLFLDIQGFVRDRKDFGGKKKWSPPREMRNVLFCVKGTEEETAMLSKDFVKAQKKKLLIITKGTKGSTLFYRGESVSIRPKTILKTKDTLGAGDTLFAYFVSQYVKTNNAVKAAETATQKTEEFLRTKSNHQN